MKETSVKIFNFLRDNYGTKMMANDIAAATGLSLSTVTGSVNSYIKKGWAERVEETTTDANGKEVVQKFITLTENALDVDLDAEIAKSAKKGKTKTKESESESEFSE